MKHKLKCWKQNDLNWSTLQTIFQRNLQHQRRKTWQKKSIPIARLKIYEKFVKNLAFPGRKMYRECHILKLVHNLAIFSSWEWSIRARENHKFYPHSPSSYVIFNEKFQPPPSCPLPPQRVLSPRAKLIIEIQKQKLKCYLQTLSC